MNRAPGHDVFFQEGSVVNFFREVCGVKRITKEVLRARRRLQPMDRLLRGQHGVPLVWAVKGERKEEVVRPFLGRRKRSAAFGLYYVMMSLERGPSFHISAPEFPTSHPDHMILRSQRSLYRHY